MNRITNHPRLGISLVLAVLMALTGPGCDGTELAPGEGTEPREKHASSLEVQPPFSLEKDGNISDVAESTVASVVNISSTRVIRYENGPALSPFYHDPFFKRFFGPHMGPGIPREKRERSLGSGVIVSGDGVILTNNHVVADAEEIRITLADEREFDAELVATDPKSEVAVIRIHGDPEGLRPVPIGRSSDLRLGEVVLAIGSPFGLGHTVTMGIVSAKGRANLGITDYEDFIQTDAAINPGNSGGALVNLKGELVGINTAIVSRSGGYQGIGLAIPSDMARSVMDSLLANGRVIRGWLGVLIQDIDQDLAEVMKLDSTDGVLVADVTMNSPADEAGLERGDVILKLEGEAMHNPAMLRNRVASLGKGKKVKLTILRDGQEETLHVTLGELPVDPAVPAAQPVEEEALGGLVVAPLDSVLRARFSIPDSIRKGVVVTTVKKGTRAQKAGLRKGDVILEASGRDVGSAKDLDDAFDAVACKCKAALLVYRNGKTFYLVLEKK